MTPMTSCSVVQLRALVVNILQVLTLFRFLEAGQIQPKDSMLPEEWSTMASEFYSNQSCVEEVLCTKEDCLNEDWDLRSSYRRRCSCHPTCQDFGFCCVNFEATCQGIAREVHLNSTFNDLVAEAREAWVDNSVVSCVELENVFVDPVSLFMVTKCKQPVANWVDEADVGKCEGDEITEFTQLIPVIAKNGMIYKNLHCLRCSGFDTSDILSTFSLGANCLFEYMERNAKGQAFASVDQLMTAVGIGECFLVNITPFQSVEDFSMHLCDQHLISSCDATYSSKTKDLLAHQKACEMYTAYVAYNVSGEWKLYKNYHCALCNNQMEDLMCVKREVEDLVVIPDFSNPILSFSVLLDFSGKTSVSSNRFPTLGCEFSSHAYDPLTSECFSLPCPQGFVLHNSSHCIVNESLLQARTPASDRPTGNPWQTLHVCFFYTVVSSPISQSLIDRDLSGAMLLVGGRIRQTRNSVRNNGDCSNRTVGEEAVRFEIKAEDAASTSFYFSENLAQKLELLTDIRVSRVTIQELYDSSEAIDYSQNMRYAVRHHLGEYLDFSKVLYFLNDYGIFVEQLQARIESTLVQEQNGTWVVRLRAAVDIWRLFNCSYRSENLAGPVCIRSLPHEEFVADDGEHLQSSPAIHSIESTLTIVFSSLSIIALVVSLTLYSILSISIPSTWNLPTKILLSLLLCLLFAHLLFLLSGLTSWSHVGCAIIAAVQHYSWLGSFAWMNALSLNLYLKFGRIGREHYSPSYSKVSLYGWGIPVVIVTICVCLHGFGLFQYGKEGSCWIVGGFLLGLSFGLPIAAMMVVNIILFILLVRAINKSMQEANLANETYDVKYKLRIHFKIFSVMGSTWVFGFLCNIRGLEFLSYPFIVLACSNGFLISTSFTLNQRFMKTFKDKVMSYYIARTSGK